MYCDRLRQMNPDISQVAIGQKLETEFAYWFYEFVNGPWSTTDNIYIKCLSQWPLKTVTTSTGYFVNGYKFQIERLSASRGTQNWGVCVKGESIGANMQDYYGKLVEVVEVEYPGWPMKRTVLFRCDWFDPTIPVGKRVHNDYNLVEVNHRRRLQKYEPFILASQAQQVFYCGYPSLRNDKRDWWAVSKIVPRSTIVLDESSSSQSAEFPAYQEDEIEMHAIDDDTRAPETSLRDPNGDVQEIVDANVRFPPDDNETESQSDTASDVEPTFHETNDTD